MLLMMIMLHNLFITRHHKPPLLAAKSVYNSACITGTETIIPPTHYRQTHYFTIFQVKKKLAELAFIINKLIISNFVPCNQNLK